MDQTLADFIAQTGADSGLARDILAEKNWDVGSALKAYSTLTTTQLRNSESSSTTPWTKMSNGNFDSYNNNQSLLKTDSGEKRLARGFSAAVDNVDMVSNVRRQFLNRSLNTTEPTDGKDEDSSLDSNKSNRNSGSSGSEASSLISSRNGKSSSSTNGGNPCHIETPTYTFTLPNLHDFDEEFRAFLEKDLIEAASLKALEGSGHLNWWANGGLCQKLWPLATTGDGNCLLHAASLGMWGFHDRLLVLRGALHLILTKGSRRHALWRRWRWQQAHQNKEAGLIFSEVEWRAEWENILRLASPQPRSKPNSTEPLNEADQTSSTTPLPNQVVDPCDDGSETVYESLEELHVFALAHVLKRPIIVIADTVLRDAGGDAFAPIPFGGIYLPLECSPAECHRSPLVLCYDAAHFSALVVMQGQQKNERQTPALVPITDKEHRLLPLHFASDPGPDFTWWSDDEDKKIAAAATLSEKAKLELVARYVELTKVSSKKPKSAPAHNGYLQSTATTQAAASRFGSHDGSFIEKDARSLDSVPRQVTGSTGALEVRRNNSPKLNSPPSAKIIWTKFTRTIRRRLKSKNRASAKGSHQNERNGLIANHEAPLRANGRHSFTYETIKLSEVADSSLIVGARLHTDTHHQFMEKLVENYLKSARARFESDKEKAPQPGRATRRERISRSFSASNVFVRCMNGDCSGQASHQTNYLCENCFRTQKQLMESFTVAGSHIGMPRTDATNSSATRTPMTFVVAAAANRASSVPFNKYCTLPLAASSATSSELTPAKPEPAALSIARSTFYGVRRSTYGRSPSPIYTAARSKFYAMNGGGSGSGVANGGGDDGAPNVTVVQPLTTGSMTNGEPSAPVVAQVNNGHPKSYHHNRAVETRYGVTAVTNPHGVTHYFVPTPSSSDLSSSSMQQDCKSTADNSTTYLGSMNEKNQLSKDALATRL